MILTIISYILIGVVVGFVCAKAYLLAQKRFYATLKHIDETVGIPDYIIAFLIFLACASVAEISYLIIEPLLKGKTQCHSRNINTDQTPSML